MRYYHVYTKGLEDGIIFRDRDDYIAGMNMVAVAHFKTGVCILAFVLMSNHFHFVIYGRKSDVLRFINLYKVSVSRFVQHKYGDRSILKRVLTSCDEIYIHDEGLKRVIAYVLDNPVKSGICCLASNYEWGSGRCYFTGRQNIVDGISVGSIHTEERRQILHSKVALTSEYILGSSGYVDPHSYVDSGLVEKIFVRPKSFEYFLATSASSRKPQKDVLMFSDTVVKAALQDLLRNKYGESVSSLDLDMQKHLLLDLRKHFNASAKQLSRISGLPLKFVLSVIG